MKHGPLGPPPGAWCCTPMTQTHVGAPTPFSHLLNSQGGERARWGRDTEPVLLLLEKKANYSSYAKWFCQHNQTQDSIGRLSVFLLQERDFKNEDGLPIFEIEDMGSLKSCF